MKFGIILDGLQDASMYKREVITKIFDVVKNYGSTYEIVEDDGLLCDGEEIREAVLKIETQGPSWVRHSKEFLEKVAEFDAIIVSFSAVDKMLLDAAKNLKYVGVMRSGVENVNLQLCKERGIIVSNSPGRVSEPVADMAVTLMLDLVRGITYLNKTWKPGMVREIPTVLPGGAPKLIKTLTIGLVGFGIIGKKVTQRLSGFGCKVIAYDPYANKDDAAKLGVELVELDYLMANSDIVSVHARLLPSTQDLVGEHELSLMREDAYFVNTARAGLVDENALIEILKAKKIRGAALDVFREEPLPDDHILNKLDNVIITPHLAGWAGDGVAMSAEIMFAEVERYLKGEQLRNQVNK